MFGYIRPVRGICDNYLFKAQYCCLCKTLGKKYGYFSRIFLSYDITFFTLLLQAISKKDFEYRYESCIIHPIKKRRVKKTWDLDLLAADLSVFLAKKKIEDNIRDEKLLKSLFFRGIYKYPFKWNCSESINLDFLNTLFERLEEMETDKIVGSDDVSNMFGRILEKCVVYVSEELKILLAKETKQLAFLMGKLIYLLDAFEDLEKDLNNWNYNPLIYDNKEIVLSCINKEEVVRVIRNNEIWKIKLLMDHINQLFSFLTDSLGVYYPEIDGIITKSLPAMVYRVIDEKITDNKGEIND